MGFDNIIFQLVVIFAGAALLSTLFLYLRQPIILAYIVLGMIIGPWGFEVISSAKQIKNLSELGIILLMFLIGLSLRPDRLYQLFGKIAIVTLVTSLIFLAIGMVIPLLFGFSLKESLIVGAALMFSSTIISLKLLPTTALHHKHTGELMISVLLMQDMVAIVLILFISGGQEEGIWSTVTFLLLKLVALVGFAFLVVKHGITRLLLKFDTIQEYTFLLTLGWGLLVAGLAHAVGLSYEIGAFVAGVAFANLPVAMVVAEELKPIREFFLILFFFSIGATFDLLLTQQVLMVGLVLTVALILLKPIAFRIGFQMTGEEKPLASELGLRLGQASEFSLLVAYSALASGHIGQRASFLIQVVVILSFVLSTYWVVFKLPTPISSSPKTRRD